VIIPPFYLKDIPVLFMSPAHTADYHKPSDDSEKINYEGLDSVTHYVFGLANALSDEQEIPSPKPKCRKANRF
jgi:hypothetical protein